MLHGLNVNLSKYQERDEQQAGRAVGDRRDHNQGPHEVQVRQQQGGRVRNTSV